MPDAGDCDQLYFQNSLKNDYLSDFSLSGKGLKLYHLNVCSLLPKIDELRITNGISNNEASVVCFSETHLSSNIIDSDLLLNGYNLFRRDRLNKSGGGIAAYVNRDIHCINRNDFESIHIESLWLEIIQKISSPLLLCVLYRPPDSTVQWFENFENELVKACYYSSNIIIMGDLNIDMLKKVPKHWEDLCNSYSLSQMVQQPTRITSNSKTLIDHIYVTKPEHVHNVDVINISLSDHCAIGLRWKLGTSSGFSRHVTMEYKRPKNIVKHTVVPSVMHDLSTVNHYDSVNEKLSCFNNALISFQDSTFRKVVRRISRPSQPKWFNVRVKSEIEKRNYYKKHGLIELFKLQRNKVVNLIRFEKSSYYKNLLINAKGDCRKLWSNFKQALGKNISTSSFKN